MSLLGISAAQAEPVDVHGRLTSTLRPESDGVALNQSNRGETPFDLLDVDLFIDAAPTPDLQLRTWLVFNDVYPHTMSLAAAMLLYEVVDDGRLYLQAGKIPVPLGNYLDRFSLDRSPIIAIPLAWHWHSSLARDVLPSSADELLAAQGTGQTAPPVYAGAPSSRRGLALLYAACYDYGVVGIGSSGSWEYRAGVLAGTPGNPAAGNDSNDSRTLAGRLGWSPGPALRVGISGAWGAYLPDDVGLPAGARFAAGDEPGDFAQTVAVFDLEASRGHGTLYSEVAWGRYESPLIANDLDQISYYVEALYRVAAGWTVGARWDEIRFSEIESESFGRSRWSESQKRLDLGSSYDVSRSFTVRAGFQLNHSGAEGFDPAANVAALQLIGRF
ncbi:MAG: hypothetical protein R3E97_05875 [Candidatus Eisenbacteria bacterium]